MSRFHRCLAIVVVLASLGCERQRGDRVVLTGSSTIAPLAAELGRAFEKSHPEVRIDVQMGGSSRGIADARRGLTDIGMVSRALTDDEADLRADVIARDGICIIVHRDNELRSVTSDQVVKIYRGEETSWSGLGGEDAEIVVVNKADGRSTLELFLEHFDLNASDIDADVVIGDNEQGIKTVAGHPNGIGYVSIGTAEYSATSEVPIALVALDGAEASVDAVRRGEYPLSRELNFVTREPPTGWPAKFIAFAKSPDAHEIIESQYLVPVED